ncbi:Farnesyl pyrophosphate synthase 1 [Papilio xuthus]|uniref:Farnesyl pyrophosphate synthase n=1 Tax=Papilio xuthus TaxID=66420 RepID=A0A194QJE6_PAPXU|nr:Farnesyl pyrophosphate synthase 1 [Papilio xuthus]
MTWSRLRECESVPVVPSRCVGETERFSGTKENHCFSSLSKEFVANYHKIFNEVVDEALARIPYLHSIEIKNRIKKCSCYFLIIDDMEDDSKIRRGKQCWHLLPDAGSSVCNDTCMLRSFIYELLLLNFPQTEDSKIIAYVNQIYFLSAVGQHLDMLTSEKQNYKNFTMVQFKKIAELKTSFPAIHSPIILALILANKDSKEAKQQVHDVCNDIGIFVQIKNDLMDLYSSNESDLKSSTDIQKGKCSWLAVKALEMCNIEQRRIFQDNYGNWDESCVRKIQELYDTLKLQEIYENEKQTQHENLIRKINELPPNAIPKLIERNITDYVDDAGAPRAPRSHMKRPKSAGAQPATNKKLILSQKSYTEFYDTFPKIIRNGLDASNYLPTSDIKDRLKKAIEYHTLERVSVQGQLTVYAYEALKHDSITDESRHQINTLAWCVEMGPSRSEPITTSKAGNASAVPLVLLMSMGVVEHLGVPAARLAPSDAIEYHTLERVSVQGQLTVYAYKALKHDSITDESRHQINTLAWCVEMSYYLIIDDIEDEAKTRNGKPCWHLLPNVGNLALNDTSMMRSFIYELLRQNLSDEMYTKISKLFNEVRTRGQSP